MGRLQVVVDMIWGMIFTGISAIAYLTSMRPA